METETKPKLEVRRTVITILLVLLTAAATGGTTYYIMNENFKKEREADKKALDSSLEQIRKVIKNDERAETEKTPVANQRTYSNSTYGFSLEYPKNWTVTDNLPKTKSQFTSHSQGLSIKSYDNLVLTIYVNPGGWGAEGLAKYVTYKSTIANGKLALTRESEESNTAGEGFYISTQFKAGGDSYYVNLSGRNLSQLADAEKLFVEIMSTLTFK